MATIKELSESSTCETHSNFELYVSILLFIFSNAETYAYNQSPRYHLLTEEQNIRPSIFNWQQTSLSQNLSSLRLNSILSKTVDACVFFSFPSTRRTLAFYFWPPSRRATSSFSCTSKQSAIFEGKYHPSIISI
jgi:hypothetical protein